MKYQEYKTNRNWLLIFGALLVAYWYLGISFKGPIPFTGIDLNNIEKAPIILASLVLFFTIFTISSWTRINTENRTYFDLIIAVLIGVAGVAPLILRFLHSIGLTWENVLFGCILILIGSICGFTIEFALTIIFAIRSDSEMNRLGLSRMPPAARAGLRGLYMILLPMNGLLMIGIWLMHKDLPKPLNEYWYVFFGSPILCLTIRNFIDLLLLLGPTSIRHSALKRLRFLRGPMDLHEMHYQFSGDEPARDYEGPLICVLAMKGNCKTLQKLLHDGADPNEQTPRGWSPLMLAAAEGHLDKVNLLLEYGADPNKKNYLGRSALMFASRYGYLEIAESLINHGANLNPSDEFHEHLPLHAAAENGHLAMVELLLKHGADVTLKNSKGKIALDLASDQGYGQIARILRTTAGFQVENPEDDPIPDWLKKHIDH